MIFTAAKLEGAFVVELERRCDERGFFARTFCQKEFEAQALSARFVQCNTSFNHSQATLRGLHYQQPPWKEVKLVRCTMGAIYDVIIDLRPESSTRGQWFGIELNADNRKMLYVPEGVAHGYLTLSSDTEVFYQVSQFYNPEAESGVRWNDPTFKIEWPLRPKVISDKDRSFPDFGARTELVQAR
ncbi:MAG: dTDP-4-dehydrorhamnose 3,5-epimerase [Candidatus Binataceae bacterium]